MFSKFLAAAALTVVSAADVPLFSSNDDYDEINLNIRMLSNHSAANKTNTPTNITIDTTMTGDFGVNSSSDLAPGGSSYNNFNQGMCTYLRGLDGNATDCVVTNVVDARRRLSEAAEKRRLASMTIKVTSAMTYPSAAKATAGAKTVKDASSDATAAASAIKTALTNAGMTVTGDITGVSTKAEAPTPSPSPSPSPAGAAPAAAAPSPSPSSNAAKVAVSTLAALSAFVASLL